jgi:hypothetical protein
MLISSLWRRPVVRVHFGAPVDLADLRAGAVGHARGRLGGEGGQGLLWRASERIMDALTEELAALRTDEPRLPRFHDRTRPVTLARARDGR